MRKLCVLIIMFAALFDVTAGVYDDDFQALHQMLAKGSATVRMHEIDWKKAGSDLKELAKEAGSDEKFGRVCQKLVARMRDSHAGLMSGTSQVP